ncbi:DNA-binding protein [Catellatospora tritici]|uniref:DNA-binding protein n=1 Tax=Catellatospora tritici TaxID=2851566 RepID=UPI001C2D21E0|nr:DNA-binding protein [Catellatospora tritici]MBV1850582.1 DNA-binding protein [Catellatospora tritici]
MAETDPFTPFDSERARAGRDFAALTRIAERHAATETQRRRWTHAHVLDPYEAVSLSVSLAAGSALPEPGEEPFDEADLTAALTLLPRVRAELDALEAGLLDLARARGLTWQAIAFGLGLGTPQAARQRYERLTGRARTATE